MRPLTATAQLGPLQLAYLYCPAEGQRQRLPLVFLHGYTHSKLDFADQLPALADLCPSYAPDLRGHGESAHRGPYTLFQMTQDVLQLLGALKLDRCHLLGHSMGGMLALRAALQAPHRFASLILMDTSPNSVRIMSDEAAADLAGLIREEGCEALVPLMRLGAPSRAVQRGIDHLGETEHWRRIRWKLAQLDPQAYIALRNDFLQADLDPDRLGAIACPVTVLVGAEDKEFLEPAHLLDRSLANSRLTIISKAAHNPQYEAAADWLAAVRAHIEWVEP